MKKTITIPLFKQKCYVYVGEEELEKFCKMLNITDETSTKYAEGLNCGSFVWIKDWTDLGCVVHEFTHCVQVLKKLIGIKDDETEAYLMQYLFEWYYTNVFCKMADEFEKELQREKEVEEVKDE